MAEFVAVELKHAGATLIGQAAVPEGTGPFPAVLVMHNALGLGSHVRETAQKLAELGYFAVATDMYGGGAPAGDMQSSAVHFEGIMKDPALLRERAARWYEHVAAMPNVITDRVAAIGYCFGGTCVLELARSGAPARAVVSYHGILTTFAPAQPGMIPGEVIAYCGAKDPYAPLDHIEALRTEMTAAGAKHTITIFGEAAHAFTDPDADKLGMDGIKYHELSARLSWAGTVDLLDAVLRV